MNSKVGAAVVIGILVVGTGGLFAFSMSRDFHHSTVGAWFPDDTQVMLVRPVHLPFNRGRAMDLWWVSLKDGKVTKNAREQVGAMHELSFLGAAQQRLWFVSTPSDTVVHRGARATNDRFDLKKQLAAHPTLSARFDVVGINGGGPVIQDQRAAHYRVRSDGSFASEDWSLLPMQHLRKPFDWKLPQLPMTTSIGSPPRLDALPYVRTGVVLDSNDRPIRPREGGGWLAVGEQLHVGFDQATKHVLVRVDDRGAVKWQLPLLQSFTSTMVDDFSPGAHLGVELRALHTTPQRVWVVLEISAQRSGNRETRIVEIDAARGTVLRSMRPHLP